MHHVAYEVGSDLRTPSSCPARRRGRRWSTRSPAGLRRAAGRVRPSRIGSRRSGGGRCAWLRPVRLEIGFQGGQVMGCMSPSRTPTRSSGTEDEGRPVCELRGEDGRFLVVLCQVLYVKRYAREAASASPSRVPGGPRGRDRRAAPVRQDDAVQRADAGRCRHPHDARSQTSAWPRSPTIGSPTWQRSTARRR